MTIIHEINVALNTVFNVSVVRPLGILYTTTQTMFTKYRSIHLLIENTLDTPKKKKRQNFIRTEIEYFLNKINTSIYKNFKIYTVLKLHRILRIQ